MKPERSAETTASSTTRRGHVGARLRNELRPAIVIMLAVLASFGLSFVLSERLGAGSSAAVMSAVLALSFARRSIADRGHSPLVTLVALPVIALGAALVGWLLHELPIVGAAVFIGGMFLSIWLRWFGERASATGALIAVPLVAMLVVPVAPRAPGGRLIDIALVIAAGLIALACDQFFVNAARWIRLLPQRPDAEQLARPKRAARPGTLPASTRMALQMAAALAAAFAIGLTLFPQHWPWIVLTAFIVCSGSRSRGDALYKSGLRLAGALGGTLVAFALQRIAMPTGPEAAIAIFVALFFAVWLRGLSYAYWAACITLVLALLQGAAGTATTELLALRLVGIVIGGICGVAACWFVLPIRTESSARRWLADTLAALYDFVSSEDDSPEALHRKRRVFLRCVAESEQIAAPIMLQHRLLRRSVEDHPAIWIAVVRDIARRTDNLGMDSSNAQAKGEARQRTAVVRSVQLCRRALADRVAAADGNGEGVTESLRRLELTLATNP